MSGASRGTIGDQLDSMGQFRGSAPNKARRSQPSESGFEEKDVL